MRFSTDNPHEGRALRWAEDGGLFCFAGGVQSAVNGVPAPGIQGDFADSNTTRSRVMSGPGGLVSGGTAYGVQPSAFVAGAAGTAIVGHFGWLSQQAIDPDNAATIVNSFWTPGSGQVAALTGWWGLNAPDGFISRPDSPAVITAYLADSTMVIQEGAPVPLWAAGGFWCKNDGSTQATVGQKAYADLATGKVSFAATGSASTASFTGTIATGTWSGTGSINGNVLTIGSITGTVAPGSAVSYSGSPTGLAIVTQLSGTAGGAGNYALNIGELTVASGTAISGTYGLVTVVSALVGTVEIGGILSGSGGGGITANSQVTGFGTGSGGTGTYYTGTTQTVTSTTITVTTNVETNWVARSSGAATELVKISTVPQ